MRQTEPGQSPPRPSLCPLIISAPFGNYIQPCGSTPTLGTFTLHRRPGRIWRTIATVRYSRAMGAWVNRIGLRNPGIERLKRRVARGKLDVSDKILSIHGFDDEQWGALLGAAGELRPKAVELNMSCPNIGQITWPADLFARAITTAVPVIVKLPPVNYEQMLDQALDAGVRGFHCCNTIPVPKGGVSGKPLKPIAIQCISSVLEAAQERSIGSLAIIGGGGITEPADIDDYAAAGATHVAVGTKAMNPLRLVSDGPLRRLIDHARRRLGNPEAEKAD